MARDRKVDTEIKASAVKKPARKRTPAKSKATSAPITVAAEERWRMIAVAAYHRAEQRGFATGHEADDWLQAEREVDALLGAAR